MSVADQVVGSVNAIIKTLECSICLELMITPVTTGCGHFFCRFCITEVSKSSYRSPCPLCKRSFTRRSIQEAHQRQSVILAAKELAEACRHVPGIKYVSQEVNQKESKKCTSATITQSAEVTKPKERRKSSLSKKRKSCENETSGENFDDKSLSEKTKEKDRKSTGSVAEISASVSINDDIIPSTNKRHRQSNADSDDDDFPSLEDILKSKDTKITVPKTDNTQHEFSKEFPIVAIERLTDMEISLESNPDKTESMEVSVIPDSIVPKNATVKKISSNYEVKDNIEGSVVQENRKGLKAKRNMPVIHQGAKFKSKVINKNNKNTLKNQTNKLNMQEKSVVSKTSENKSKSNEKSNPYEFTDEEVIKENKQTNIKLFFSPKKTGSKKNNSDASSNLRASKDRSNIKRRLSKLPNKTEENKDHVSSSSAEEESMISNIKEAENFSLNISTFNSNTNSDKVTNSRNDKEYNLTETTLPPLTEGANNEHISKQPQTEYLHVDEIADTAVSVQAVASPEAARAELVMKSPGWSRVKQVGKDFKVRKFSRLQVEKNTSNSSPLDVVDTDQDSAAGNAPETVCQKQGKKLSDSVAESITIKDDTCIKDQNTLPYSALSTLEKKANNVSPSEKIKPVYPERRVIVDDKENKEINDYNINNNPREMPTFNNESEYVPDFSMDYNCHETATPITLKGDTCSSKVNETFEFDIVDVKSLSNSKSANENNDTGGKITCDVVEPYGRDVNSSSNNKDNLPSHAIQLQTNRNVNDSLVPLNIELPVEDVYNVETNFTNQSMEVDNIPNGKIYGDTDCNYNNGSVAFEKPMHGNNLPKYGKDTDLLTKYGPDNENVYYMEHAQQTSQRLLDYCDERQQQALVPLTPMLNQLNVIFRHDGQFGRNESVFNRPEQYSNAILKTTKAEKTKVLKKTCLTLEEIQEAFANNNVTGKPETICSLPFLSGDFRLNVCVSEETLNISVVKVVDSEVPHLRRRKTVLLRERSIQTSNPNTPISSPTILPSSNVESESSQPDSQPKSDIAKKSTNPFPYLSEYFSDTEPSERVVSVVNETILNDSEVFPYVGPTIKPVDSKKAEEQALNKDAVDYRNSNNMHLKSSVTDQNTSTALDVYDNLPATQPYQETAYSSNNFKEADNNVIQEALEKDITTHNGDGAYVDININTVYKGPSSSTISSNSKFANERNTPPSVENSKSLECVKNNSPDSETLQTSYHELFDDGDAFSSDPDMAYAMEMVGPLKNIGDNIDSKETKGKSFNTVQTGCNTFPSFSSISKEKNPIETFEEMILSKNKDTSQSTSFNQKKSRLSLKSNNNPKKFKRIKTCDSDDDLDEPESPNNQSLQGNSSKRFLDKPHEMSNLEIIKNSSPKDGSKATSSSTLNVKDVPPGDSLQDNSTFNLSEEMTNNSNEIAKELEDLDEKILSVFEKLKQCGHENVLELDKQKQLESLMKNKLKELDKVTETCDNSSESEDSVDIFSQSVPPTPEKTNSGDSMFKSVTYSHK